MRPFAFALLALLMPLRAGAADLLTAEEFDAYTRGKTLSYTWQGQEFGKEQYLPGHRVMWAFTGDECRHGEWYESAGNICFVYDDDPEPKCWTFQKGPTGLLAKFVGDPDGTELSEVAQSPTPLGCPGPDVGA
ncbi:MAG: hypothetical protein QM656_17165 [Paracoccaceae bacterium]